MPRDSWWSYGGGQFLMSEVPLYQHHELLASFPFAWPTDEENPPQEYLAHKKTPTPPRTPLEP
jgi:hypothetical protein